MNDLSERIKAREKKSRQIKFVNTLLSIAVIVFIVTSVLLYSSLKKEKAALIKSETDLQTSYDSISKIKNKLAISDSILSLQNEKLLQIRGSIHELWKKADSSGRIKDYASYLESAIEDDEHYTEALNKMNTLANDKGYVQITDSNGIKYLSEIENLNTNDVFYRVIKAMSVRYGVIGDSSFSNTSRTGNVIKEGDVVKIMKVFDFNSGAQWAELRYDK
jgi:hypothetical protein